MSPTMDRTDRFVSFFSPLSRLHSPGPYSYEPHRLINATDYSYPGFFYEQTTGSWIETLGNLGVESRDPANGNSYGAFIATSAIDPTTWSRSYSKTGYLDPYATRSNLVVLTGYQATKVCRGGAAHGSETKSSLFIPLAGRS